MGRSRTLWTATARRFPRLAYAAKLGVQAPIAATAAMFSQGPECPERVTPLDAHHLVGYYDNCPWDATDSHLVCLRAPFADRHPAVNDPAQVLIVDTRNGRSAVLAETRAWNLQLGCRSQWLGPDYESRVLYNDYRQGRFVSVVRFVAGGQERVFPEAVWDVSPDGTWAIGVDFERIHRFRPGYGYCSGAAVHGEALPADDGLRRLSLTDGASRLLFSVREIAVESGDILHDVSDGRVKHVMIDPTGQMFMFVYRRRVRGLEVSSLFYSDIAGGRLHCLMTSRCVSHATWESSERILVWADRPPLGQHFYLIDCASGEAVTLGENLLREDGHPTYSPCRRYILLDTYADLMRRRTLYVCDTATGSAIRLYRSYTPPRFSGETRCDLHPRWSRDGRKVCFDGCFEGTRQVYMLPFPRAGVGI